MKLFKKSKKGGSKKSAAKVLNRWLRHEQKNVYSMYVNSPKKFSTKNLLPYLSQTILGRKLKVPLWRIIKAIISPLKSGCQWR